MMNTEEFQIQAKYIWDRLDDLAASDPKGYEKFIDQQMKEREAFMSLPVPTMCFFTKVSYTVLLKEPASDATASIYYVWGS